jgi:hypothetical protein
MQFGKPYSGWILRDGYGFLAPELMIQGAVATSIYISKPVSQLAS